MSSLQNLDGKSVRFGDILSMVQNERKKLQVVNKEKDTIVFELEKVKAERLKLTFQVDQGKRELETLQRTLGTSSGQSIVRDKELLERRVKSLEAEVSEFKGRLEGSVRERQKLQDQSSHWQHAQNHGQTVQKSLHNEVLDENKKLKEEMFAMKSKTGVAEALTQKFVAEASLDVLKEDLKKEKAAHRKALDALAVFEGEIESLKTKALMQGSTLNLASETEAIVQSKNGTVSQSRFTALREETAKLLLFREKHSSLISTIENATDQKKMCLVTSQGCVVTTMADLRKELFALQEERPDFESRISLPTGWERSIDSRGKLYYIKYVLDFSTADLYSNSLCSHSSKTTSWIHPSTKQKIITNAILNDRGLKDTSQSSPSPLQPVNSTIPAHVFSKAPPKL